MAFVHVDDEGCKACGLCISVCPKKIIVTSDKMNHKGYQPVKVTPMEECIGCAACAKICPDCVLRVEK